MCSFLVSSEKIPKEEFAASLEKIKFRGPDATQIKETEKGIFGFNRLYKWRRYYRLQW